jgi:hypothetical protein
MIQNKIKISFLQQGGQSSEEMMTHPTILLPSSIAGQFFLWMTFKSIWSGKRQIKSNAK